MTEQDSEIVDAVARAIDPRAWAAYDQAHREPLGDSERMLAKKNIAPSIVEARAAAAAHVAALEAAGIAMAPIEPTEEMLIAARDWSISKYGRGVVYATGCWRAMIAARPDQR